MEPEPSTTVRTEEDREALERRRDRRALLGGCLGVGGLTIGGLTIALAVVIGAVAAMLQSCDLEIGTVGDPGDGTSSARLDVLVVPATGLREGSTVTVGSQAFEPERIVGVAVCLAEADTQRRGVGARDEVQGARFATDVDGLLRATYAVPRRIRAGGRTHDCATRPGRCVLVAADASDYNRSGGQPLTFDEPAAGEGEGPTPPTTRPETLGLAIAADPAGPVGAGTSVELTATGFQPGEPLLLAWCTDDFARVGPGACEPSDSSAALGAVVFRTLPTGPTVPRADAEGRAVVRLDARATIAPTPFGTDTPSTRADGRVDCRTEAGRCSFVVAAAADTQRSAVLPYEVAGG
ncbi:MAG: neocarzinostatin apoprotein domain-containing protein [Acidimicrobiales bacterium]